MNSLPNKPSELIRVALADLESCERDPRYRVSLSYAWHSPTLVGGVQVCSVCLAGAVMARTFECEPDDELDPEDCGDDSISSKLRALDSFRHGHVLAGLRDMCGPVKKPSIENERVIASYADSPGDFKRDMRQLAADLEVEGL